MYKGVSGEAEVNFQICDTLSLERNIMCPKHAREGPHCGNLNLNLKLEQIFETDNDCS